MAWSVIEFQDETGEIMVARMPQQGTAELVSGSQLIVQDGQIAAFFHDGQPTDAYRAGRYTLTTQNVPVLSKVLNRATFGQSPFRSYVYFIAMKTFTDLGWGTSTPILFRDEEFKMVNLRAHGSFAIRIQDPKVFLLTLVGSQGFETSYAIEQYLRKSIVSTLAQILPALMKSVLDLPAQYGQIAVTIKSQVHDQFAQYGLKLVDLMVEAITVPPEVQEMINRAAATRGVGRDEAEHYERMMRVETFREAAKQPGSDAGSAIAAGMGIGAGISYMREAALPPHLPPAAISPPTLSGSTSAPVSIESVKGRLRDLKELVDDGLITAEDFESKKKELLAQL